MMMDAVRQWVDATLKPWFNEKGVPPPAYTLEEPPAGIEGDLACNLAMLLAKPLRQSPRALAQELQQRLQAATGGPVTAIAIAGAGFLNFTCSRALLLQELTDLLTAGDRYGHDAALAHTKVLVEYVSANPTGPLHVGHGRGAALGDSLALILAHLGYGVTREYYINDAGNQVRLLGESVLARVLELEGKPFTLPEEGYQGEYVKEIAKHYAAKVPTQDRNVESAIAFALQQMLAKIQDDLAAFGVEFDHWFSEKSLLTSGAVEDYIRRLESKGCVEHAEGAMWFVAPGPAPAAATGETEPPALDKNRVLKKKDGRWTYFATDIAYHANKYERGFDRLIDVWGADHHGYVPRVKGSMQALGYDPSKLQVILNQMVSLTRNGTPVAMSKRSGEFVTLRDVIDEVGRDACRFFFALRGPNTAFDFDLELAKQQTADNPVYYLQYAHARICSIFRQAEAAGKWSGKGLPPSELPATFLSEKEERDLLKRLLFFTQCLRICVQENSPHPLATYLLQLARQFHHFYDHHRILGDDLAVTQSRLTLLQGVRQTLRLGLKLLGVSAPEAM